MTSRRFAWIPAAGFASLLYLACVSDESGVVAVDHTVEGGATDAPVDMTMDGSVIPSIDGSPSGGSDGSVVCAVGSADCDPKVAGCETNILVDDTNCGMCGRDCGGKGLCKQGVCAPLAVLDKQTGLVGLGVVGSSTFVDTDLELERCASGGCTTPTPVAQGVHTPKWPGTNAHYIVTDAANVYWVGYTSDNTLYSIFTCPFAGCTNESPVSLYDANMRFDQIVGNATQLFFVDSNDSKVIRVKKADKTAQPITFINQTALDDIAATDAYFIVSDDHIAVDGGGLFVCTAPDDCAAGPKKLLDPAQKLALQGTTAFTNQPMTGTIVSCDVVNGCNGTGVVLSTGENAVTSIASDGTNVYWSLQGSGNASDGTIRACTLPDCKGGARNIATSQTSPTSLTVDGNFLYWLNRGTGALGSSQIMRIRR